ncbi:MAG: acyl CoA:acetate/3-ketoacid CoA transferase [Bacteroidetes bacterium]|nr:acyl CoA:acetate/3-ketoacid CoA transferase [Bacteroidota bacterium]
MPEFCSLATAAMQIPDHAVVTVSSSSGLGCPDAMLAAIGERFAQTRHPQQLTTLHPIAAGDMYGIDGIDYLAQEGLLKRVIAGSLPSGPSSMDSPKIWKMIDENRVEAYNIPSGILYHMHREVAAKRPGVLTKVGIDTFVDPLLLGGRMNDCSPPDVVKRVTFDGDQWLFYKSIPVNVAVIRGTTSDQNGNITTEHEGSSLGIYDQALAAHNNGGIVIAQVKRVVTKHTLRPQQVRVPGIVVDYVVIDPDQMQTTNTQYDPTISGEKLSDGKTYEIMPWGSYKPMARRAALELRRGDTVNLGFGIAAQVPRILLEEGLSDEVTWVIEQGAVGGLPLLDFQFGCASGAQAILSSSDQFTYFQGGGFDKSLLSFMQIDASGNVNVSRLAMRPHVTAGVGGFIDITAHARHLAFIGTFTTGGLRLSIKDGKVKILQEGKVQKLVPTVEHVSFSGERAILSNQHITYITERCVLRLLPEGLTVTEIAPGIDLQRDVLGQTTVPLNVSSELKIMDSKLFDPASMNLQLPAK